MISNFVPYQKYKVPLKIVHSTINFRCRKKKQKQTLASTQTCFDFCQCFFYVFVLCCLLNFDIKSLQKETCLRWQVKTVLVHTGPVVLSLLCFKTSILQTCGDIVKERSPSTRYTVLSCSYTFFWGKIIKYRTSVYNQYQQKFE